MGSAMNHSSTAPWPSHGGQSESILAYYGFPKEHKVIDFSTNLNPLGPPAWLSRFIHSQLDALALYPDPNYTDAINAIAQAEGVQPEQVCLTNGGSEAIFLSASLFAGKRSLILEPTFAEYRRACDHYGLTSSIKQLSTPDFHLPKQAIFAEMAAQDVVFIARPNNPTGILIGMEEMEEWIDQAKKTNCTLIVDEAFIDFAPHEQNQLPRYLDENTPLILLRSLTKMFTLPGLRIGYILANPECIAQLKKRQIPWSVNTFAANIVPHLLHDSEFLAATHDWLTQEHAWLLPQLRELHYSIPPTQANFFLLQPPSAERDSNALLPFLLQRGLLARHTHNFAGLNGSALRFAIRSRTDNAQLLNALREWSGSS
ncbi:threonine-phosphate decarboxylase [Nitrincola tibetensis]|uniref:threonine-phosphate decarboxylase n=2 Tax=Nitrincola tibetensis TaxID=2219697 RepID=A0A364NRX8_9GAMM|nr:threonine-phosphate decarboxylase [Nitrincola tibetensis]